MRLQKTIYLPPKNCLMEVELILYFLPSKVVKHCVIGGESGGPVSLMVNNGAPAS